MDVREGVILRIGGGIFRFSESFKDKEVRAQVFLGSWRPFCTRGYGRYSGNQGADEVREALVKDLRDLLESEPLPPGFWQCIMGAEE